MATTKTYAQRVKAMEDEGATTSDAQAVVDAENMIAARPRSKKDAKGLPNKVRQHREKAGMSPKELAAQIGGDWSASTVRRIERGARKASVQQMAELGKALDTPASTLFPTEESGPAKALPKVDATGTKPARKPVVGKRTGKALTTKEAVKDEIVAVLSA